MRNKREWFLLSVAVVLVIVIVAFLLHSRGYLPYGPTTQNDETPPIAPSGLSGQADSYSQITIQWTDNSNNEDGFRIYHNGAPVESVGPDITTFQDNDLEYATVYSYLVTAYNEYGETECSTTAPIRTLNPPIVVTLGGIGVIFDHDPLVKGAGDIYVYIAITDGTGEPELIRVPSSGTLDLNDNESTEVRQQLFARDSVGDELKIAVLAFESDDPAVALLVNMLREGLVAYLAFQGVDISLGVSLVTALLQSAPSQDEEGYQEMAESTEDDFVGAIEQTWTSVEDWGIGSYADVRNGNLRLWFTISTSSETAPVTPPPTPAPFSVAFDGWYVSNVKVDTATKGGTVTARLTLSGGTPGEYTIRIRRAITLATDQTVGELPLSYDGTSVSKELSFVPAYATGESSTEGYHIDIVKDGSSIWTMTNDYPPRLAVSGFGPFTVSFNGWYVDGTNVDTATKGETVVARITLSGGEAGQYKMCIRRDIQLAEDQTVKELTFSYDGTATARELSFSPQFATDESGTDGYHIDVSKDGDTVWTLIDAYPPRLRVTIPVPTDLSVTFDGWYIGSNKVNSAIKSDTVIAKLTLSGGSPGQYKMRVRRDIAWAADATIAESPFSYDGTFVTKQLAFIPPYAGGEASTNGYHVDLLKDGSSLWTLTDAYPPRLWVTE